jgi:hypothetical protein
MTLTLDIRPETQAELTRQAAAQGRAVEAIAAALLEEAVHPKTALPLAAETEPTAPVRRTGQSVIDAFADIRGLLTDEEINHMFTRNPSTARPVDLS